MAFYNCKSLTIKCYSDSYAEQYAKKNKINYELIPSSPARLAGDVNGDGEVTVKDVTLLNQHLAKWNVTINKSNANVNGDDEITVKDVTLLKQHLAKWKVELK